MPAKGTKRFAGAANKPLAKKRQAFVAVGSEEVLREMEDTEPLVMKALKEARSALAQKGLGNGKIRPTSVASDAHLAFLAKQTPTSIKKLRKVPGFGPSEGTPGNRVKHYGKVLLDALADARAGRRPAATKQVKRDKVQADKALIKMARSTNKAMFDALKVARKVGMIRERTRPGGNPCYPAYVIASDVDLGRVALHNNAWATAPATIEELRKINKFGPTTGEPSQRVRIAGQFIIDAINSTRLAKKGKQ